MHDLTIGSIKISLGIWLLFWTMAGIATEINWTTKPADDLAWQPDKGFLTTTHFPFTVAERIETEEITTISTPNQETPLITPSQKRFRTRLLISSFALGTALYGAVAWWDNSTLNFQMRHEGWFEEDSPNGGADKLGHAFSFYVSTRLMTTGFQWAGHDKHRAVQIAGLTSATLSLGVEMLDGLTEKYGFSSEDLVMNLGGIGVATLLENYPSWDELLDIRVQYWPSDDARKLKEYDVVTDYSGQTYLLIAKASGMPILRENQWLRYFELAVGYGTRGYQPTDGTGTQPTERNLYYGISLNLSQVLNDWVFKQKNATQNYNKSQMQNITEGVLEYLQMPGTALLYEHHL